MIVLALYAIPQAKSLFETSILMQEIETYEELTRIVLDSDFGIELFIYNSYDCVKCIQAEKQVEYLAEHYKGLLKFYHLDCDKL